MSINDIMLFYITRIANYFYCYFLFYFFRLGLKLKLFTPPIFDNILDTDNKYIEPIKKRFLKIFENFDKSTDIKLFEKNSIYNSNIESAFYNKSEIHEIMQTSNNELEKIWQTRILFENTPRGNVILFYDAFKQGFSYYCDQKTISYDLLNAAAMKYVSIYRCLHFFIDETIIPDKYKSPFIKLYFAEEIKNTLVHKNANTFAHMRNYGKENPNAKKTLPNKSNTLSTMFLTQLLPKEQQNVPPEPDNIKNKFMYLGKINNFKVLQSLPKKRKVLAKFKSPLLENIKLDSSVQRETMSFKDFKTLNKGKI